MQNQKHYNIIVVGTFDCENFGDLLFPIVLEHYFINRSITAYLHLFSPQECRMPFFGDKQVHSVNNMKKFLASHEIDAIVIGGGDLIRLDNQIGKSYTNKTDANLLWAYPIILGNLFDIPIVFNCPGVPFEFGRENKQLVKCLFSGVSYISVRDVYSKQYLLDCGVSDNITVSADTVIGVDELYPATYIDTVFENLKHEVTLPETKYLVFQINNSTFSEENLIILKDFIERVVSTLNYEIVFMPIGYEHNDDVALERLAGLCNCKIYLLDSKQKKLSPEQMIAVIKHAAFFVGTSLHGAVVSYVYGTGFMEIMSGFSTKIYGFCNYIHAEECVINIQDDLWERFSQIVQGTLHLKSKEDCLIDCNNHINNMLEAIYKQKKSDTILPKVLELCISHEMKINKPKVYFNYATGYSEAYTKYGDEITPEGKFHIRCNVESGCIKVRLDPVEESCILLLDYAVCDKGLLRIAESNGIEVEPVYLFNNNDPRIEFYVPEVVQWIELEGYVFAFTDSIIADKMNHLSVAMKENSSHEHIANVNLLMQKISSLKEDNSALATSLAQKTEALHTAIENKNKEIKALESLTKEQSVSIKSLQASTERIDAKNRTLNAAIQEKDEAIASLNKSLVQSASINSALENRIRQLEDSTCWRLTKPFRAVVIGFRTLFSKRTYGRLFKKMYMAIPINIQTKMRIKGCFFKLFAPLLKNTEAYKKWKDFTGGINEEKETQHNIISIDGQEKQYLEQIMDIPFTKGNDEYVPKISVPVYPADNAVKYLAFYLPQYHPFPENDQWWGEGFTEWTNVTKAVPQFVGHNQPRLAGELGYYDLRNKDIIVRQMELAKQYGIYGFCIYYYWFDGKKLMDTPLKLIMENEELDLPFCLCWANENWSRKWDGKNQDILIAQNYDSAFREKFIKDVIPYLQDNRYIRISGKPVLIIYNANEIPDLKQTIEFWRDYCRKCQVGEIHLLAVDFALNSIAKAAGFNGFIEFPPHSVYHYDMETINSKLSVIDSAYAGNVFDYGQIVREKRYLETNLDKYYKGIFLGWDNTARRPKNATVYHNFTISAFKQWLTDISKQTEENHAADDRFVFINAWNEWAEGTYLEPDRKYGYAALDAVRQVLLSQTSGKKGILYVSHDACYNGAQLLSLNIIEQLSKVYKYNVYVILIHGGVLLDRFQKTASDIICLDQEKAPEAALKSWLQETGCKKAMCNTVISGEILKFLSESGIQCISMIHEMEQVIRQYHAEGKLADISKYADSIVFASDYVRKSVDKVCIIPPEKVVIAPQGNYKINRYGTHNKKARDTVRRNLCLPENVQIVLGVGFGDDRKGIDLFVKAGIHACEQNPRAVFVWVGEIDPTKKEEAELLLSECPCKQRILFAGPTDDVFLYYTAADLFLLTSREDPFPTVVMEAMEAGLPVIAFRDGGGYVENVTPQTGVLVEMEAWKDMAEEANALLDNQQRLDELGQAAHAYIAANFNFIGYVHRLLALLGEDYCKISVVIPNYNYGKYLKKRILSVLQQDYPVYEIILLDDVSKDNSVEIMEQFMRRNPLQIRMVQNKCNSGNVFNQWEKGCRLATGDYIWIAEADDLAEETFLSTIMKKMTADPSIVLGYSQSYMMDENGKVTADNYFCYTDDVDAEIWKNDYTRDSREEITQRMSVKNTIPNVSAVIFKKRDFSAMFQAAKKFRVAGDWAFYISLLECGGKVAFIAESLNYHRRHSKSVTTDLNAITHFEEICKMQNYIISLYENEVDIEKIMAYRKQVKVTLGVKD